MAIEEREVQWNVQRRIVAGQVDFGNRVVWSSGVHQFSQSNMNLAASLGLRYIFKGSLVGLVAVA
jgi:hypothetical protein